MASATNLRSMQLLSDAQVSSESSSSTNMCDKTPEGKVKLPEDDSVHDRLQEWWYWICNFEDETGMKFEFLGLFMTFYTAGTPILRSNSIFYIDDKVTYQIGTIVGDPTKVENGYSFDHGHTKVVGGDGYDQFYGSAGEYTIEFTANSTKAPFLYYEDGYTDFSFGGDVYYYARPRYATEGTITRGGNSYKFTGTTFFEHAFGHLDAIFRNGWDWFRINLDSGDDVVVMLMKEYSRAWVNDKDCNTVEIDGQDIRVKVTNTWTSPRSACKYPSAWELEIEGKKYVITPTIEDIEIVEPNRTRWEGPVIITGDVTGRGIAEVVGDCF